MDPNWTDVLPGDPIPAALESLLEDWDLNPDVEIDVEAPLSRSLSPDVYGELYAVGRFGEPGVVLVWIFPTIGPIGPDATGRVEYVRTTLDPADRTENDAEDPGAFLDWAGRDVLREMWKRGYPVRTVSAGNGGDPKCD